MQSEPQRKPNAEKLGWRVIESRCRFENHVSRLREDRIDVPGKKQPLDYLYLERAEAVIVVPVTDACEIILIRQYRYPTDEWCLEVPAGGCHDAGGASLEDVVKKELSEEIGASVREVERVNFFYTANSLTDEKCHVYLALGARLDHERKPEASEELEVTIVSASKALQLARAGEMKSGPCALALFLCEERLRELGFLK